MWDSDIRILGYGLYGDAERYASVFMPRMQKEILEAIDTYAQDNHTSREQAIELLSTQHRGEHLTKLLDEFNYTRFNRYMKRKIEEGEGKS
jgi:hypothetical protein